MTTLRMTHCLSLRSFPVEATGETNAAYWDRGEHSYAPMPGATVWPQRDPIDRGTGREDCAIALGLVVFSFYFLEQGAIDVSEQNGE